MKEHNDEVIKKYKKSIFIDLFVSFVPMSTVIFCTHVFTNMYFPSCHNPYKAFPAPKLNQKLD